MSERRCPWCHDELVVSDLGEVLTACRGCLALHHAECWSEGRGCATCAGQLALVSAQAGAPWVPSAPSKSSMSASSRSRAPGTPEEGLLRLMAVLVAVPCVALLVALNAAPLALPMYYLCALVAFLAEGLLARADGLFDLLTLANRWSCGLLLPGVPALGLSLLGRSLLGTSLLGRNLLLGRGSPVRAARSGQPGQGQPGQGQPGQGQSGHGGRSETPLGPSASAARRPSAVSPASAR